MIWIRSGWLRDSIYWVLLFWGRFLSQNHYPRSTGAPSCRFRALTRPPPSVDSGLSAAFVMLGLLAPLFMLRIEEGLAAAPAASRGVFSRITGGSRMLIASFLAAVVIIALIGLPSIGALAVIVYAVFLVALPYWLDEELGGPSGRQGWCSLRTEHRRTVHGPAGSVIAGIVRMRYAALAVIAVVTAFAVLAATDVGTKTEPSDFFPSGSVFVTSIDKTLDHSSTISPGDVLIYVEGNDLTDPRALRAAAATHRVGWGAKAAICSCRTRTAASPRRTARWTWPE